MASGLVAATWRSHLFFRPPPSQSLALENPHQHRHQLQLAGGFVEIHDVIIFKLHDTRRRWKLLVCRTKVNNIIFTMTRKTARSVATAALWHRGILILTLLFVTVFSKYSDGQEILTVGDEAMAAADTVVTEDVVDLGNGAVVKGAKAELMEVSDVESIAIAEGIADDKTTEEEASKTATVDDTSNENISNNAGTSESTSFTDTDNAESIANEKTTDGGSELKQGSQADIVTPIKQSGPYIDLLGDVLLSLEMVDESHAQVHQHYTNEALRGKKVVGLYFSADW